MKIGICCDVKDTIPVKPEGPEDALEEYDSRETVEIIKAALETNGHSVIVLGGGRELLANIQNQQVDFVFNIAEGLGNYRSREAQVPSLLEMLDVPYTGSDPLCLSVCLDKPVTKKLVKAEFVLTPRWLLMTDKMDLCRMFWEDFPFPAVVKPAFEGSSKGIRNTSLVYSAVEAQEEGCRIIECYHQPIMIEEYIEGDEVTVGVVGNTTPEILGIMQIVPKRKEQPFIYSLEVKRDYLDLVDYECPARLSRYARERIAGESIKLFKTLGCRDFARIDFRVTAAGIPYFIEINPLPGLGTYSDLVIMAKKMGWTHEKLIQAVLNAALERHAHCVSV